MAAAAFELEAPAETEALLAQEAPGRRFGAGGVRVVGAALGVAALVVVGAKTALAPGPSLAAPQDVIGMSGVCSNDGDNCAESRCCNKQGSTCYRKNEHWASCNQSCSEKELWEHDGWVTQDHKVWDCHAMSSTADGQNCIESKSCSNPGSQCYLKNEHWASCNQTCSPDNVWNHDEGKWEITADPVWSCKTLSCTADGDNCMTSRCCQQSGSQCYLKNEHWASCNQTCDTNMVWNHDGGKWETSADPVWDCKVLLPEPIVPVCDLSECIGCSGEQCQYCREGKERDCCLEENCDWAEEGEQMDKCKFDNLQTCCDGKTGHCARPCSHKNGPNGDQSDKCIKDQHTESPTVKDCPACFGDSCACPKGFHSCFEDGCRPNPGAGTLPRECGEGDSCCNHKDGQNGEESDKCIKDQHTNHSEVKDCPACSGDSCACPTGFHSCFEDGCRPDPGAGTLPRKCGEGDSCCSHKDGQNGEESDKCINDHSEVKDCPACGGDSCACPTGFHSCFEDGCRPDV